MTKVFNEKVIASAGVKLPRVSAANGLSGLTVATETARTITLLGPTSLLYAVTVDQPCRIRVYGTTAEAVADIARAQTVDPSGNHGCLLELIISSVTVGSTPTPSVPVTVVCEPVPTLVNQNGSPTSAFAANVRCDNGSTLNVTVNGIALE